LLPHTAKADMRIKHPLLSDYLVVFQVLRNELLGFGLFKSIALSAVLLVIPTSKGVEFSHFRKYT
jgi:hypothetical protein